MSNARVALESFLTCADEMKAAAEALQRAIVDTRKARRAQDLPRWADALRRESAARVRNKEAGDTFCGCWIANETPLRALLEAGKAAGE